MKKKILSIALIGVLAIGGIGCTSKSDNNVNINENTNLQDDALELMGVGYLGNSRYKLVRDKEYEKDYIIIEKMDTRGGITIIERDTENK